MLKSKDYKAVHGLAYNGCSCCNSPQARRKARKSAKRREERVEKRIQVNAY